MKNRYEIQGEKTVIFIEYKEIILECAIDTKDLEKVSSIKGKWHANKHHTGRYYIRGPYKSKKVLLHRFLMEPSEKMVVDHINNNSLDNRRRNLRIVTNAENKQNLVGARSDSKNGIRGVYFNEKSKKWMGRITVNGKYKGLGSFQTREEAEIEVKKARAKYMPYSQEALSKIG